MDLIYHANSKDPTITDLLQVLEMLQFFGFYKLENGDNQYPSTTKMIDDLTELLESKIQGLDDQMPFKVNLALAFCSGLSYLYNRWSNFQKSRVMISLVSSDSKPNKILNTSGLDFELNRNLKITNGLLP